MGIAVATMVVFSAAMKRVDWAVAKSACESGFQYFRVSRFSEAFAACRGGFKRRKEESESEREYTRQYRVVSIREQRKYSQKEQS